MWGLLNKRGFRSSAHGYISMATRHNLLYSFFTKMKLFRRSFLILFTKECQILVSKFKCKVFQNDKNRTFKYLVVSISDNLANQTKNIKFHSHIYIL